MLFIFTLVAFLVVFLFFGMYAKPTTTYERSLKVVGSSRRVVRARHGLKKPFVLLPFIGMIIIYAIIATGWVLDAWRRVFKLFVGLLDHIFALLGFLMQFIAVYWYYLLISSLKLIKLAVSVDKWIKRNMTQLKRAIIEPIEFFLLFLGFSLYHGFVVGDRKLKSYWKLHDQNDVLLHQLAILKSRNSVCETLDELNTLIEKRKAILTDLEKQVIQKKNHLISLDLLIADRMKSSERIANQLDIKISSLVDQCNELEKFKAKLQFDTFNREVVHQDLQFQINILEADLLILTEKSQENCIKTKKNRLFRKALQDLR